MCRSWISLLCMTLAYHYKFRAVACAALEAQRRAESEDLDKVGAENEPDSTRFQAEEQKPGNILTDLFLQGLQILNNN